MSRESWQRAENVLGALALCSFLVFTFLQLWFCNESPRLIDQASGPINLVNCHGSRIYLTNLEQFLSNTLLISSVVLMAGAVAIEAWIKPFGIRMPWDSN
jgi:hypothetical protein